jgi:hypothetical protein
MARAALGRALVRQPSTFVSSRAALRLSASRRRPALQQLLPLAAAPARRLSSSSSLHGADKLPLEADTNTSWGGNLRGLGHNNYLGKILNARVYEVAVETPLQPAPTLSAKLGNTVLLKREDLQPVFSFKIRGAHNKIASLSREQVARGIVACSAGNHAQGVSLSASTLGIDAVMVTPNEPQPEPYPSAPTPTLSPIPTQPSPGDRDAHRDACDQGGRRAQVRRHGHATALALTPTLALDRTRALALALALTRLN